MEEESHSFLGGLAAFQLGRMFQDHLDSSAETVSYMLGRRRQVNQQQSQQSHVAALSSENQRLIDENAQLRHQLALYKANYDRLKKWADSISE